MFSPLEYFTTIQLLNITLNFKFLNLPIIDFSLFNTMIPIILLNIFIVCVLFLLYNDYFLIPTGFQYIIEFFVIFIFNIIKEQTGKKGYVYFPFLFTCFFFILFCNFVSLVPFGISLTSHIIMIIWLSVTIVSSVFVTGFIVLRLKFFLVFIPTCPAVLLPFLVFIEIFSYTMRMVSLAVRLSANVLGGHTLVSIISLFLVYIFSIKFWFVFIGSALLIMILFLEFGVSFLQAYVFVVLVSIYLKDSLYESHH